MSCGEGRNPEFECSCLSSPPPAESFLFTSPRLPGHLPFLPLLPRLPLPFSLPLARIQASSALPTCRSFHRAAHIPTFVPRLGALGEPPLSFFFFRAGPDAHGVSTRRWWSGVRGPDGLEGRRGAPGARLGAGEAWEGRRADLLPSVTFPVTPFEPLLRSRHGLDQDDLPHRREDGPPPRPP